MAENRRDAQKMFDKYLLDYMVKRNMHETAAHFRVESNVPQAEVHTDTEEGFLHEWWTILHDMMTSREGRSGEVPPPPMFNVPMIILKFEIPF
ncbi:unnamed protein product [Linum trigynum]|uniref:LisH domain-containing protein n=1 Tax=Linum trigynum TaxID=586398 RepID=A0AAV2DG05_9ROSI